MLNTDQPPTAELLLTGTAEVRRARRTGFPAFHLLADGKHLASLGRFSFFNIFFGRGQRIQLANGRTWRLGAVTVGPNICPLITNEQGRRVSQATLRHGSYGINGREYGYVLKPDEAPRWGRENRWVLIQRTEELAHLRRRPRRVSTIQPVPVAAALLAFVLMDVGIPGEDAPRLPAMKWG